MTVNLQTGQFAEIVDANHPILELCSTQVNQSAN